MKPAHRKGGPPANGRLERFIDTQPVMTFYCDKFSKFSYSRPIVKSTSHVGSAKTNEDN